MNAVIFDLDGTLWNSSGAVADAWNTVFIRLKMNVRVNIDIISGFMGKTVKEIAGLLFPDMETDERTAIIYECVAEEMKQITASNTTLYPGIKDALEKLGAQYPLFIVSNCQCGYIEAFLHEHCLENVFSDFEMEGRTGLSKGENIKLIMQRNGIDKALYVGDTEGDERSARFAGIPFVHAAYGFGKSIAPDHTAKKPEDIPGIVSCVFN